MAKWINRFIGLLSVFCLLVGCAVAHSTKLPETNSEDLSNILFGEKIPNPILVTDIATSKDQYSNKIEISWKNKNQGVYYSKVFWFDSYEDGLAFYNDTLKKYYKEEETDPTLNSSNRLTRNIHNYQHTTLTNDPADGYIKSGSTFYYLIRLYDITNIIVGYSELFASSTAKIPYDIMASQNFKQENESSPSKIELSWKWDEPNKGFVIYKKEYGNLASEFKPLNNPNIITVSQNSFFLIDNIEAENVGKTYQYKIEAILENGKNSNPSNQIQGRTISANAPDPPQNFSATKGLYKDSILLSWTAPTTEVESYTVNYRAPNTEYWEELESGITECKFKYEPPNNERKFLEYSFQVVSVRNDNQSAPCTTKQEGKDFDSGFIIPKVKNFNASFGTHKDKIELSWAKVRSGDSPYSYTIYRSKDFNDTAATVIASNINETTTTFTDNNGVVEGEIYYYSIVAISTHTSSIDSNIGYATDLKETVGVMLNITTPVVSATKGEPNITLSFTNKPDYCLSRVEVSRPTYAPKYQLKPGRDKKKYHDTKPSNYEATLQYKCDPSRYYPSYTQLQNNISTSSYTDNAALPGINRYKVRYFFKAPEGIDKEFLSPSIEINDAYRAISNREFLAEALKTVDKSQYHLTNIHFSGLDAGAFDSLKKCSGSCSSKEHNPDAGCFHYCYMGAGPPVLVYLRYNMYKAYDMIFESVNTNHVTSVGWNKNGSLTGYINIHGIYPGKLDFNLTITDGVKAGGSYTVTQSGKASENFSWDFDRADVEAYLKTL